MLWFGFSEMLEFILRPSLPVVQPAHLPRKEEVIEPEGLEEGMKKIGEEVTELLEHIPGKL